MSSAPLPSRETVDLVVQGRVRDLALLTVLVAASMILYIRDLGFYSDDWAFLGVLRTAPGTSFPTLLDTLHESGAVYYERPMQEAWVAGLFAAAGLEPWPYHVANAVVFLAAVLLLYLVLRELAAPRALALAASGLYATMPHFSSARFWLAAHQATLSVTLLLLGTYAALRAVRAGRVAFVALGVLALVALALASLAYELVIPMFLLPAGLVVHVARRGARPRGRPPFRVVALVAAILALLAVVLLLKAVTTDRPSVDQAYVSYVAELVGGIVRINVGAYGAGLPLVLVWIATHAADPAVLALGCGCAALVAAGVWRAADESSEARPTIKPTVCLLGGLAAFALGYVIFLVPSDISLSSASLGNRITIGASLGLAVVLAAAAAVAAGARSRYVRPRLYATLIGLLCGAFVVVTNTLAGFWESTYREQQRISAEIRAQLPDLPAGSAVIVDGVCLERGGAYVFTGARDVRGLLWSLYGSRDLEGTAVSQRPGVTATGIEVPTYSRTVLLPYGERLIVYNGATGAITRLPDERAARRYFARPESGANLRCPPGFAWRGDLAAAP